MEKASAIFWGGPPAGRAPGGIRGLASLAVIGVAARCLVGCNKELAQAGGKRGGGETGLVSWDVLCQDDDPLVNATGEPDHALFTSVLAAHVRQGEKDGIQSSLVDYTTLRADPSDLAKYLRQFCSVDLDALSVGQRLATLLNAYNAVMLSMIVSFEPPESVREISSWVSEEAVWKHKFGHLAGQKVSLDDIEHGMIRGGISADYGALGRIHAAVNCASLSCPDLLVEAFTAEKLEVQLDDATRAWLANPTKNPGPSDDGKVHLSKIFTWYGGDFIADSGSVQAYVRKYSSWDVADDAELKFIEYNWALNGLDAEESR